MRIDVQLSPALSSVAEVMDGALAAEEAGFDTFWVFDHFLGSMIGGEHMLEPFALLGALSAATRTIGLGSLVLNVANRSAAVIASGAATVQALSEGRFTLGLGAGASPRGPWGREHRVLSNPVAATLHDRHARLVSTLDEIDRLWSPERDEELATFPQPPAPTPMVLGVNSPQLAELAGARCDGLNVRASHEHLADLLAAAMRARASSGRSDRFDVSVWARWDEALFDPRHADRIRWEGLGVNRLILACFDRVDLSALRRATGVTGS